MAVEWEDWLTLCLGNTKHSRLTKMFFFLCVKCMDFKLKLRIINRGGNFKYLYSVWFFFMSRQ